jgi:hypothetical protein
MILSKIKAYFLIVSVIFGSLLFYQGVWLISGTIPGHIESFETSGRHGKQIDYIKVNYQVNRVKYSNTYLQNNHPYNDRSIQVRYLLFSPGISRMNTFAGNWGFIIVVLSTVLPFITICFLVKEIVPSNAKFILKKRFPFLQLYPIASR